MTKNTSNVESRSDIAEQIIQVKAKEWISSQYLPYAVYAVRSRALVSVDGLKPVNRRILYSMYKKGITPNAEHLKASRAASDTMAYHPHGNSAIEGALARMAQDFSLRVPLIDPYGTVGYVTGDAPASARYWECRLTPAAMEVLRELKDGAVPMGKNFDGKLDEPYLLPTRWPINTINGTEGIAVGYASKMFSHNPDEVMKALKELVRKPNMTVDRLLKIMPGPDLPTGGELLGVDGVRDYYETGKGSFVIRSKYRVDSLPRGRTRITFYELPYSISVESVIEQIQKHQNNKKLTEISVIKDLTGKESLEFILETKSGTNHVAVLHDLFRLTSLEERFSVNTTILVDKYPRCLPMLEILKNFLEFRRECTTNKAKKRVDEIDKKLYQIAALLKAVIDIDKCISIIRKSTNADTARTNLMRSFKLEEEQANFILSMQLRKLTKSDSVELKQEKAALEGERKEMNKILKDKKFLDAVVVEDLEATRKIISDPRRTTISGMTTEEVQEEAKKQAAVAKTSSKNLPCYLTAFSDGTILNSDKPFAYRADASTLKNGPIKFTTKSETQGRLVIVNNKGIAFRVPMSYITLGTRSNLSNIGVELANDERVVAMFLDKSEKKDVKDHGVVLASRKGEVKVSRLDFPKTQDEFPIFKLSEGDEVIYGSLIEGEVDGLFVSTSSNGNILAYDAATVRPVGSSAGGMKSQKPKSDDDVIVSFAYVKTEDIAESLILSRADKTIKMTPLSEIPTKGRGAQGVVLHKYRAGESTLTKAFISKNPVVVFDQINSKIDNPPISARAATGVELEGNLDFGSHTSALK